MNTKSHLGAELVRSLKKNFFQLLLIDYSFDNPLRVKRGTMLVMALELSKTLKRQFSDKRVGVVLPPGFPGILANLSLIMVGKIPVNLNFTIGSGGISHCLEKANINSIITAGAMIKKLPDFPWTDQLFDLGDWLKEKQRQKWKLAWKHLFCFLSPVSSIEKEVHQSTCDEEAALLFTSGSSGNPKGVPLSHFNLLSNCLQIQRVDMFENQSRMLANLPLFHSFGFTICTLFPLLSDLIMVCVPTPLDVKRSLKAIEIGKVEVVLGTPTFLRGYLRKARKEQLLSVKYVIAGAEKTPDGLAKEWESICNCTYLEGYGLTESSPAIAFNLPGNGARERSVGHLLPEIKCKTISPDTKDILSDGKTGILCFKGPNFFHGYLNDIESTNATFDHQGWYITGDLGRLDSDGFLFIEGRLSRFSKIGGEMVPHSKVEEEILKIIEEEDTKELSLAVVGISDAVKGEKLLLLTTREIKLQDLRSRLLEKGMPNLWVPKIQKVVSEIPMLATGKLDLRKVKKMADENFTSA